MSYAMPGFAELPDSASMRGNSRFAVLPVPFDLTSSWRSGSAAGPEAVIKASRNMELYDLATGTEAWRRGIYTHPPVLAESSVEMLESVYKATGKLLDENKFVVTLGGEHTVAVGAVRAHAEKFPGMGVLQLDAHADLRETYEGSGLSHACTMARIREIVPSCAAVGVRSACAEEFAALQMIPHWTPDKCRRNPKWMDEVLGSLPERVYITLDVDVFDPSVIPATGTPEPGGLSWFQVFDLIRKVVSEKELVGLDISELRPEENPAPDFCVAKLIYQVFGITF